MPYSSVAKTRNTLVRLGGLVLLLLLLNGLIGLAAIRYSNEAYITDVEALKAIAELQDLTQTALIDFKKQVQEWKNILLRGNSPKDLATYRAAFEREHAAVQSSLKELAQRAEQAGLDPLNINAIINEHVALKRTYDAALIAFIDNQGATSRITDATVRGEDRALTNELDAFSRSTNEQSIEFREAIRLSAEARYHNIVLYTLAANALIAVLVTLILINSLRVKRAN